MSTFLFGLLRSVCGREEKSGFAGQGWHGVLLRDYKNSFVVGQWSMWVTALFAVIHRVPLANYRVFITGTLKAGLQFREPLIKSRF